MHTFIHPANIGQAPARGRVRGWTEASGRIRSSEGPAARGPGPPGANSQPQSNTSVLGTKVLLASAIRGYFSHPRESALELQGPASGSQAFPASNHFLSARGGVGGDGMTPPAPLCNLACVCQCKKNEVCHIQQWDQKSFSQGNGREDGGALVPSHGGGGVTQEAPTT